MKLILEMWAKVRQCWVPSWQLGTDTTKDIEILHNQQHCCPVYNNIQQHCCPAFNSMWTFPQHHTPQQWSSEWETGLSGYWKIDWKLKPVHIINPGFKPWSYFSGLLNGITILAVFQNLMWNSNKTSL